MGSSHGAGWPGMGWMGRGEQSTGQLPHVRPIHNLGSTFQACSRADSGCESLGGLPRVFPSRHGPSPQGAHLVRSPQFPRSLRAGESMRWEIVFSRQSPGCLLWDMFPGSPPGLMTSSELKCPFLDLWILRLALGQAPQGCWGLCQSCASKHGTGSSWSQSPDRTHWPVSGA